MVKVQHKLSKAVECLEYFTTHQWSFKDDNVRDLLTHMSQQDRESFQFDVSEIHWEKYMEKYVLGFREFLFKQSPKSLPSCRRKMSRSVFSNAMKTKLSVITLLKCSFSGEFCNLYKFLSTEYRILKLILEK